MFKLKVKRSAYHRTRSVLKGLLNPIPYEIRIENGNWFPHLGVYENQKWGVFDTEDCWCVSGIKDLETQLNFLWPTLPKEAQDFFQGYGFADDKGIFHVSERLIEILSGVKDNGNTQEDFWRLVKKYGFIPRSLLTYTNEKANTFMNKEDFNTDYFGKANITQGMRDLALQVFKYINIDYQQIGKTWTTPNINQFLGALKQAPLQIGIPVPYDWNRIDVIWDGGTNPAHAIELYHVQNSGKYDTLDQYNPALKTLSADYYIPIVTQGVVTAKNPVIVTPIETPIIPIKESSWLAVWKAVWEWIVAHGDITRLGFKTPAGKATIR